MRPALGRFLAARPDGALREAFAFWCEGATLPEGRAAWIEALARAMEDPRAAAARRRAIGKKLGEVLDHFLGSPAYTCAGSELRRARAFARSSPVEIEAAVQALERRGFLHPVAGRSWRAFGEPAYAVPAPLAETLLEARRLETGGIQEALTLRGALERGIASRRKDASPRGSASPRTRTVRLLLEERGILARLDRLPPEPRRLAREAAVRVGGILPRSLFERIDLGFERFEEEAWRRELERASLGTVRDLELLRYGIGLSEPSLLLFAEVTFALLKRIAREEPPAVAEAATCGVDFATDLSRLLGSLPEGNVRFTAQGTVFRTTERRLEGGFLPPRTREISPEETFDALLRFSLSRRLVDRTGERTFTTSPAGRTFGALPLEEKMRRLLDWAIEERGLPGEMLHQGRLRRLLLRLLRRLEPERWVDAMFLPFLARNAYLTRLDRLGVEETFGSRSSYSAPSALEDPQRLAWNLFAWIRRRLHPLGLVDLGYDGPGRLAALRVSRFGARLLGPRRVPSEAPSLLVGPDFEVVLFPGEGDPYDLVHALDRFCDRTASEPVFRFRIREQSVRLGIGEGMSVAAMQETLKGASRAPLPQNVLVTLRTWAGRAGLVRMESVTLVRSEEAEVLDRFLEDPAVRERLIERTSPTTALLREGGGARSLRSRARDLGVRLDPA